MNISTADSDVNAIEYLPGTLIAALDETWTVEDSAPSPRYRPRTSKAKQAVMRESQDAAAAAERWAHPFRSSESPVLYTLMCQTPQCGGRKTARSKGLWSGNGKGYIAADSYKVLGLDHRYVQWLDGSAWHGLHLDFDRPVTLGELQGRVSVVVFAPGTFDAGRQTYTSGCHTLSILGIGHSIPMHLATTSQKQGIKRLVKAAIAHMDADPAGSTGRIKNPLCEQWEIHILREQPFSSLAEIGNALGLNDGSRRRAKPSAEPASVSRGIGPVVAEIAGKLLRDRGGPQGWQDNVEMYVHAVIEAALERLGLTCDRAKVGKTGGAIARKMWRTYNPALAGAPRRERNAGRLAGQLEDVAPEERKSAAGRWRGEQMERQARHTRQALKDAFDSLVWRAKGSWEEVSQTDLAALSELSLATVKRHWASVRQHFLGVAEKRKKQTSQQSRISSLNKTVSSSGVWRNSCW